ncbi:MAG: ABC transporter substrate-binding protein [Actinomycetota bacterium]
MRATVLRRLSAIVVPLAVLASACSEPVVPLVQPPATVTPVPAPTPTPAPTVPNVPTPTPAPFEGEPGISAGEIRIGVIVDISGDAVNDQLSLSALQAVQAWASSLNDLGGLVGRQVVVEPIETSPLLADHAVAINIACNRDFFALVGSTALFDGDGLDQLESPQCGIPDFPAVVNSQERLESRVTTVSNPIVNNLWVAGSERWLADTRPDDAAAAATMLLEFPVTLVNGERMIEAAERQGYEFVHRPQIAFDTDFVDEAVALGESEAALLTWRNDGGRLIDLLGQLAAQEIDRPSVVECGQACYSEAWVDAAGADGDGVSVWLPTLPLEELDTNAELTRYFFLLSGLDADAVPTSTGIAAWASALLFEEAVNIAVGTGTADFDPNAITRSGVIAAADSITQWDARGLHGTSNPSMNVPSACFVVLTLNNGQWERTFPALRGELDCAADNLVNLTITTGLGSEDPTPTPEADPPPEEESEG